MINKRKTMPEKIPNRGKGGPPPADNRPNTVRNTSQMLSNVSAALPALSERIMPGSLADSQSRSPMGRSFFTFSSLVIRYQGLPSHPARFAVAHHQR